jgi:DNA-binding SARP family transcriptional activator
MIRFRVLGRFGLERIDGPTGPAAEQRKPLALLTLLTMARSRGLTREKLVAFLWPESNEEASRNTLKQTLYSLRRDLAVDDLIVTGPAQALVINPAAASADVWTFEDAIDRGALEEAVDAYTGPFLDGFFLRGCAEFEQWAERERARLAALYAEALNQLAQAATQRGDHTQAVQWWRRLAVVAPLDSRVALRYMEALVASGDRSAAIVHASVHHALLREELGAAADPGIVAFADRLRNGSEPSLRRSPTSTPMVVDEISQSGPQEDVFTPPPAVPEHAAAGIGDRVRRCIAQLEQRFLGHRAARCRNGCDRAVSARRA